MTEEMDHLEAAARVPEERGVAVSLLARFSSNPAAELAGIASSANALVIAAAHPDYQAVTTSADVRTIVTVTGLVPQDWDTVVVRAGAGASASAAAEVASQLAAGRPARIVVDPAGLSGRPLDRFVGLLGTAGLNAEISGLPPDDALIVARHDGPQDGAHLIVRAGPEYTPEESAPVVVADLAQKDR
jgi:hypothetical protein